MPASRSLIALLVGTVVFFALWMIALKPSSSSKSPSGSSQSLGSFNSAINQAHQAVATSNKNDAASGNENATSSSGGATTSKTVASSTKPAKSASSSTARTTTKSTAAKPSASQKQVLTANVGTVEAAVSAHKVVALLFYNPAAADDQAVKQEFSSVPTHRGQVVKLAVPVNEAANFTAVTQQVPVNLTPTLVLVSRAGDATEIVGYSDPFEIDQRVDDALAAS